MSKVPISLNLFETNYEMTDYSPPFFTSHNVYCYTSRNKLEKFSIWEHIPNKSDSFFKTDVCFDCYRISEFADRSSNLYIYTKKDHRNLFITSDSVVNLYVLTLHFYKLCELEDIIIQKRNDIFSIYNHNNRKIYSSYNKLSKEILKIKTSLSNVAYEDSRHLNDYIKKQIQYYEKKYNELNDESKEFEKYFENKLSIQNIIDTRNMSYISIAIAFISLIIAIVPLIYSNSKEKENAEIVTETKNSIEKIDKDLDNIQNELINIKDEIKENKNR